MLFEVLEKPIATGVEGMNFSHGSISSVGDHEGSSILEAPLYAGKSADVRASLSSARLAAAAQQNQRAEFAQGHGAYYGETGLEEKILNVACPPACGVSVTRNHYGCLVLNSTNALFIDVDMPALATSTSSLRSSDRRLSEHWKRTFDDIRTVLASFSGVGFRIYRTAAGFRILATGREFQPGSPESNALMHSVGADAHFVKLCRSQQNFRARLTPKPWRCGLTQPPGSFPRLSEHDRCRFAAWLSRYERANCGYATCQFLEEIRPGRSHERVDRIVDFHDQMTKAFQYQLLA